MLIKPNIIALLQIGNLSTREYIGIFVFIGLLVSVLVASEYLLDKLIRTTELNNKKAVIFYVAGVLILIVSVVVIICPKTVTYILGLPFSIIERLINLFK